MMSLVQPLFSKLGEPPGSEAQPEQAVAGNAAHTHAWHDAVLHLCFSCYR